MASSAQIKANRANALKSTGPRTPEGKAAARRNALRHGLQSGMIALDEADELKFNALLDDLLEEHRPVGPTEELVFCKMVEQYWLSRRGAARLSAQTRLLEEFQDVPRISLICRYNTAATNGFYRALRELDRLQARRLKNAQPETAAGQDSDQAADPLASPDPEIGFVPKNAETPAAPITSTPAGPQTDPLTPIPTPNPRLYPQFQPEVPLEDAA